MTQSLPKPEPVSSALGTINEAAVSMARKWHLIDEQGQLWCIRDGCQSHGTYPSLCCPVHLAEHRRRLP